MPRRLTPDERQQLFGKPAVKQEVKPMPKKPKIIDHANLMVVELDRYREDQPLHFAVNHPSIDGGGALCGAGAYVHVCRFIKVEFALHQKERKLCAGCRTRAIG